MVQARSRARLRGPLRVLRAVRALRPALVVSGSKADLPAQPSRTRLLFPQASRPLGSRGRAVDPDREPDREMVGDGAARRAGARQGVRAGPSGGVGAGAGTGDVRRDRRQVVPAGTRGSSISPSPRRKVDATAWLAAAVRLGTLLLLGGVSALALRTRPTQASAEPPIWASYFYDY